MRVRKKLRLFTKLSFTFEEGSRLSSHLKDTFRIQRGSRLWNCTKTNGILQHFPKGVLSVYDRGFKRRLRS